ncbi:hypothetical protein BDW62DRAFT_220886 [Aspergillus aurantiobrunneus]
MTIQKAVVITSPKQASLVTDHPIPALREDYILVKNASVALNPTDWKHIAYHAPPGVLVGCDYAGVVQEVGKNVKKPFKKGDRICGFIHGSNEVQPEDGAFAEYVVAKGDIQMRIPDSLSFEEASTLGVGIMTVGQSLYQSLKLALPTEPTSTPAPILIYGGSTATGALAIQFAKLSGYTVITTCSPRNFDFVKSLGADAVFEYSDPDSAGKIREYTDDNLKLVLDTISIESSIKFCDNAISTRGGDYSALLLVGIERENVNDRWTIAYTAIGEEFKFGQRHFPAKPEDKAFAEEFAGIAEKLLAEGKVKVHRPKVCPGGLAGVLDGLKLLKEDKSSIASIMPFYYNKVLIIGATSGIGKALATKFVENNIPLVISGRREENLREFVSRHGSDKVQGKVFDVTKLDRIPQFASEVLAENPDIDCIFINSGIQRPFDFSKPETVDLSVLDQELVTNYTSAGQNKQTRLVFTTSQMALVPMMRCPNYGASKAALHHFILALRTQLKDGPGHVRVLEIYPPAVQTELHDAKHQPDLKDGYLIGMALDEFINEVCDRLSHGEEQVAVGSAKDIFETFEVKRQKMYEGMTVMLTGLIKQFLR